MIVPEQAAARSKNNMYNITLDGVSAYTQQCEIYEFSQQINMMSMLRIAHKYCIMLILMT